ncbi:AAA family ATPase [Psychrobacillus sp. FJAT-51614]|uniref:AAA family ATPase n=1 Tax=Psychrobacillus mangrovi TaxID=3117745 RepID=A0ABU8F5Q8_9BACI
MKIEKLHIYGFGKHENVQIDFQSGLNVLYGENEAGKSSIQQFILHILFGFPQKNAQLLRYEPKSGAAYGGKVQLFDEQMGRVIIERIKGKASGDVILYFENGNRGGEKELATLLNSYNRSDFEAIFSFSLLQLQGFEKMTEEELTRTLLSSGTTGMDTLSKVEAQFVKEMGELFKPSGKKPLINQKIDELRVLDEEWKQYLEEVNKYDPAIKRLKEIDSLLIETSELEKQAQSELQRFMRWKQLKPIKEKQIDLAMALEKVQNQTFPTDGIRRYETIKDKEMNVKITNEQLRENLKEFKNNNKIMSLEELDKLKSFLSNETEWHQLRAKRIQIEEEQSKTLQNQMQQLSLVGINWEKNLDNIIEADVSIQQEEKLVTLLKEREKLESELLQEKRILQMKKEDLHEQKTRISEVKRNKTEKNKADGISVLFSGAILLLGFILSFLLSNWMFALAAFIVSIVVFSGFNYLKKTMKESNDIKTYESLLLKEEKALFQQISQLENKISELEQREQSINQHVQLFLNNYHLSGQHSPSLLKELFNRLRLIQEQQIQLEQMELKLNEISKRMEGLLAQAKTVTNNSLIEDMLFHQLREYYLQEKKKFEDNEFIHEKINDITMKQKENLSLLDVYADSIHNLFQEANAETENDFYEAHRLFEQKVFLEKEFNHLQMQLGNQEIGIEDFKESFEQETNEQLKTIQKSRNELVQERATLVFQTNRLLKDEKQSEMLQKIEQKKAELQEYVKQWAALKAVVVAINKMMVQLKEERLPEVLEMAQSYFKRLTSQSYEQLILSPEGIFEAVKYNGQRFKIVELSQATKEQAYLSLRIALALCLKNKAPFPIIMDDPFVHFDRFRLQQVVQLMEELQKEHQLLYFTCHENMQYVWQDVNVIQVATLLAGSGGIVK